jgi:predicted MPP superfamily phosphohydrolase
MRPRARGNRPAAYNSGVSIVLLIIGLVFACDLLWWRTADRILRPSPRGRRWRPALATFMAAQVLCLLWIVLGRTLVRDADALIPAWVLIGTFVWHLLVLPATLVVSLLVLTGRGVGALVRKASPGPAVEPLASGDPDAPAVSSRRQFLGAAVAAAPPLVTVVGAAAATAQLDEFRVRPITLPIANLPPDLDGMTVAHVSDIHVGRFTNGSTLDKIVNATNNLRSDLVLLTGDLINMSLSDLPAALDAVRKMQGRHGVYMVEGNHDLIEDRREFRRLTKDAGVRLLVNETAAARVRGADVQLLGLRWGSGVPGAGRSADRGEGAIAASLAEMLPALRPANEAFPILLAHHPHALDHAAAAGIPLTLSGHTHGGQLMLTPKLGFGPWMYRYWSGAYRKDNAWGVVSNGVGNWFPLRVAAPAEIIHLTLRRA